MKKTLNTDIDPVGILKDYCKKHRIYKSGLARMMNINYKFVINSLKGKTMDIDKLVAFSHALQYNFLRDLAAQLPASYPSHDPEMIKREQEILQLKEQLTQVETEKKLLEKMWLGKG